MMMLLLQMGKAGLAGGHGRGHGRGKVRFFSLRSQVGTALEWRNGGCRLLPAADRIR